MWNWMEQSGMENQKQLSLLLSVMVQTELHLVWQSFPNSHNMHGFWTTIIEQSINYKYNKYSQLALNISMLSATARKLCLSAASPSKTTANKRMTKNKNAILPMWHCEVMMPPCEMVHSQNDITWQDSDIGAFWQAWSANSVLSCAESAQSRLPCDFPAKSGSQIYCINVGICLLMRSWKLCCVPDFGDFCFWKCNFGVGMYAFAMHSFTEELPK